MFRWLSNFFFRRKRVVRGLSPETMAAIEAYRNSPQGKQLAEIWAALPALGNITPTPTPLSEKKR